jgi:hypothetical protein
VWILIELDSNSGDLSLEGGMHSLNGKDLE